MSASSRPDNRPSRGRGLAFIAVCAVVAGAVAVYALLGDRRTSATPGSDETVTVDAARIATLRGSPHLLFRITALGPSYGRVGIVPLADPGADPAVTPLSCDRVHASAGYGLCLQAARGVFTTYRAVVFDSSLAERHSFKLAGAPSRTRVAPKTPFGTATVFVSGDSYAAGGFSTRTTIFDFRDNSSIGDLETFQVTRDGAPFKRQDFNFWGVTFDAQGDRFYATLSTQGALHLVEGSIAGRTMRVIADDVECPSLSPDGTRLVYKARITQAGRVSWRLRVLTLASGARVELSETRNVDDQAEWLDNEHVLYALPRESPASGSSDIWSVRADGAGEPRLFVRDAWSPAVVR